jgi:hypothetical protein
MVCGGQRHWDRIFFKSLGFELPLSFHHCCMFIHVSCGPARSFISTGIHPVITVASLQLSSAKYKLKGYTLLKDYNYRNTLAGQACYVPLG